MLIKRFSGCSSVVFFCILAIGFVAFVCVHGVENGKMRNDKHEIGSNRSRTRESCASQMGCNCKQMTYFGSAPGFCEEKLLGNHRRNRFEGASETRFS